MTMNVRAINHAINEVVKGEKYIMDKTDITVVTKKGGWADATFMYQGHEIKMKLRSNVAKDIVKAGKMRYSTVQDRLYSHWIQTTKSGKEFTARRQVEGMRKRAADKGADEMVGILDDVLKMSDKKVREWRAEWEKKTSDKEIEQFYNYDPGSELDALLG